MPDLLIAPVLLAMMTLQAPPATAPSTSPAAPPVLSGPDATEDNAGKLTLITRTFDGHVESVGPEPEYVAIGMLELTPEQRAKYDEIHSARLTTFDQIIRSNYGLIVEIATLQSDNTPARRGEVLRQTSEAFKPYLARGTFFQEMWPHLNDAQRTAAQSMVKEYRDARADSLRRQAKAGTTPVAIATQERLEAFGEMVRDSIERQIGLERDSYEAIASELQLTPEQRNAAEAIFQEIAIKRFQNLPVSKTEQAAAIAEFNRILTAGQKQKAFGILLRQYQKQDLTKPETGPSTPPAAKPDATPQAYKLAPGPFAVSERLLTFTDASRNRDVPVKLYMPKDAKDPTPVIVFSHGWGGNRDGGAHLGKHWASHGYFCVMVEHDGSDTDFVRAAVGDDRARVGLKVANAMRESVNDSSNWTNRPLDVTFVLDELNRRNGQMEGQMGGQTGDELFGRLDLARVGMSGHSFGAYTTMLIMGALVDLPGQIDRGFRDSRCVAGIAMSSQGDGRLGLDAHSWDNITAPMLYFTGTKDYEMGGRDISGRRVGFDRTPADKAGDQYLMTIDGGEHMAFSDNARGFGGEKIERDPAHHQWILSATTAFWDAYVRGDDTARQWLQGNGLAMLSNKGCAVERR